MPQMGFDMKEGTVVRWLKQEGDPVQRGEAIAEIETDKAMVEVEAFGSGVLRKVVAPEGTMVPVGELLALIGTPDEVLPEVSPRVLASASEVPSAPTPRAATGKAETKAGAPLAPRDLKASPIARRLAEEHGVDLQLVKGTGPGGRIQKEDVQAYLEAGAKAPPAVEPVAPAAVSEELERIPLSRMRQAIARRMVQSKKEIPHFYVTMKIDMTEALRLRKELNETAGLEARVSINDMVVVAAARVLQRFPQMNSTYTEEGLELHPVINIGIAIALEEGLIAPAILDCGQRSLAEIAKASHNLQERAKGGVLKPEEYTGATFNITNLGMYDVEEFIAIITPGQSGALALGTVGPEAVVKDDQVVVRQMMKATLSADHRATDGAQAALFLSEVRVLLENPLRLLA